MPGVDDGARDREQARAALGALRAAGATTVITTPHFNASLTRDPLGLAQRLGELDTAWAELQRVAAGTDVRLHRAVELALDVPQPDLREPRLRLAGTAFVLVEFAFMTVPPNSAAVLGALRREGWIPVLAHPERYGRLSGELELARAWREAGALLQVNGASLLGRYGAAPKAAALRLLELGYADYLSSDYHARGEPGIADYREALEALGGQEHAQLLLEVNPQRILHEQLPLPVPPLRSSKGGILQRMRRIFR